MIPNVPTDRQGPRRRSARTFVRYRTRGVLISFLLHASLLAIMLALSFHPRWFEAWNARQSRTIQVSMAGAEENLETESKDPGVRIVTAPSEVTPEMVRQRLDDVLTEAEGADDEQTLQRLDQLSGRLSQLSGEDSVDAMAGTLQSLLGTSGRATVPAERNAGGEFDFDTAQFHDVRRFSNDAGGYSYVTVLLDAEGRTIETEMDQVEGEHIYQTMQRIKANPLLEQVYRQIAMPLLDQILAAAKQTASGGPGEK